MVKLRLRRLGRKKTPVYRVVACDSRSPRDGRFIEQVGRYNPCSKELVLNKELILKWLSCGAQLSPKVRALCKQQRILVAFHEQKQALRKTKTRKIPSVQNAN